MRLAQRVLTADIVRRAIATLEIIEMYPEDKYLPSFLVRGESEGVVFHAQIATDLDGKNIRIVTMYVPDQGEWDNGLRVRRRR